MLAICYKHFLTANSHISCNTLVVFILRFNCSMTCVILHSFLHVLCIHAFIAPWSACASCNIHFSILCFTQIHFSMKCFMQHSFLSMFCFFAIFISTVLFSDLHVNFAINHCMQHSISQDMFHARFLSPSYSLNMKHCCFFHFCNTDLHILISATGAFVHKDTAGTLTATNAMTSMSVSIIMDIVREPVITCLWTETKKHMSAAVHILDINWHQMRGPALVNIFALYWVCTLVIIFKYILFPFYVKNYSSIWSWLCSDIVWFHPMCGQLVCDNLLWLLQATGLSMNTFCHIFWYKKQLARGPIAMQKFSSALLQPFLLWLV